MLIEDQEIQRKRRDLSGKRNRTTKKGRRGKGRQNIPKRKGNKRRMSIVEKEISRNGRKVLRKNMNFLKRKGKNRNFYNPNKDISRFRRELHLGNRNHGSKKKKFSGKKGRQTETVSSTCFTTAINFMKIYKDVIGNFDKQNNRMEKQNKTGGNKSNKKGEFASVAFSLVDIGGGNKSNLSCSGSYTNSGAKQISNLTIVLFECELEINKTCNTGNFPQPNTTFLSECETLVTTFKESAGLCLNKTIGSTATSTSDACSCWTATSLNTAAQSLKKCSFASESQEITKQLKKCKNAFIKCRKYEDDAISSITACSQSSSKLTAKAAQLTANSNAMTSAKTKMSSLASGREARGYPRATATSCAEIISKSKTCEY